MAIKRRSVVIDPAVVDFDDEVGGFDGFLIEKCRIIGENVRAERRKRRFSIEDLANYIDLSPSYVGLLERGDRCPSLKSLFRLCELFQCEPNDLLSKRGGFGQSGAKAAQKKSHYGTGHETVLSLLNGLEDADYTLIANMIKAFRKYKGSAL
jgi:transcriptional regulator with XRE-family HTH domain